MRYFKYVEDGIILSVGDGFGGEEITKEEYDAIVNALANKPSTSETTDYMLKEDLTWEAFEVEPVEPEPTEEEIINILTGESND